MSILSIQQHQHHHQHVYEPPRSITDACAIKAKAVDMSVKIKFATDHIVSAKARDDSGIHDVRWASYTGWQCTCGMATHCAHVGAVSSLMATPTSEIPNRVSELRSRLPDYSSRIKRRVS